MIRYVSCWFLCFLLWPSCQAPSPPASLPKRDYQQLTQVLTAVYERDQRVRQVDFDVLRTDSLAARAFSARVHHTDSLNQSIVLPLLATYGWLPRRAIGEAAADALYLVVQHSDLATMKRWLPLLQEQAQQGEASKADAATMWDRVCMLEGKKQRYGTQAANHVRADPHVRVIWPIETPVNVDSLRQQVGFTTTVQQNADRLGVEYDPREKLPTKGDFIGNE